MIKTTPAVSLEIRKTYSSYGNYAVRVSNVDIRFFMRKKEALAFVRARQKEEVVMSLLERGSNV